MHFNFIRSNLAPFGLFFIRSNLVLFGPFYSFWSYSVHFGLIWPTLVLFDSLWSYSVHLFLFSLIWSYSVYLVLFSPICSNSILFGPILSTWLFGSIWSKSVQFGPHIYIYTHTQRAGSRLRQVRPRPKAPPKNKNFLGKKGPTFHS